VGIGVTPSSWSLSGGKAIELSGGGLNSFSTTFLQLVQNAYYNGTNWIYKNTAGATLYQQGASSHVWQYAASGTAGNPVTFTTGMTLDSSGNVGIGTSSPSGRLDVESSSSVVYTNLTATAGGAASVLSLIGGSSSEQAICYNSSALRFGTVTGKNAAGFTERMRLDSSGNLLVGTTTTAYGTISGKFITASSTSGSAGLFYTGFAGDVSTSALNVGKFDNNTTTSQIFMKFGINNSNLGSGQINANGSSAAAFGSFSDRRLKENIVDLPSQLDNIMALRTVEFDYIESEGGGHQIGFIAQEVQEIYPDLVGERADGMLTLTDLNKNDARLIKAIQEMKAIIDAQASTITSLTDRITALETPTGTQA